MKRLSLLILIFATSLLSAIAQESSMLYFSKHNPVRHNLNPAFMPDGYKVYVGIPGLSNIDVFAGNNSYILNDFCKIKNGDVYSVFDSIPGKGIKDVLSEAKRTIKANASTSINILNFGFTIKEKHFINFGINFKTDVSASVPSPWIENMFDTQDLSKLKGSFDLGRTTSDVNLYTEFALGLAEKLDEKSTVGVKFKYLLGHVSAHLDMSDVKIKMDYDEWILKGKGEMYVSWPVLQINNMDNGQLYFDITQKEVKNSLGEVVDYEYDIDPMDFVKPQGHGFAVDLGATYKMLDDRLALSVSLIDLGFLKWNTSAQRIVLDAEDGFTFQAANMQDGETPMNMIDLLLDEFNRVEFNKFYYADTAKNLSYRTALTTKLFLGGEYSFLNDKISVGLLSKLYMGRCRTREEFSIIGNFRPHRFVDLSLGYDFVTGAAHNIGLGANFNLGPINLFVAADQIPLKWSGGLPVHTMGTHVSAGVNMLFGWTKFKQKKEESSVEDEEIVPETETTPENVPGSEDSSAEGSENTPEENASSEVESGNGEESIPEVESK